MKITALIIICGTALLGFTLMPSNPPSPDQTLPIEAAAIPLAIIPAATMSVSAMPDTAMPDTAMLATATSESAKPATTSDSATSDTTDSDSASTFIRLSGEVQEVGANRLRLASDVGGQPTDVIVPETAEITRNGRTAVLGQIIPGDRARITAVRFDSASAPIATVVQAVGLR
jgi:hypothetical protein